MEQRFTYQGEQYEERHEAYPGRRYIINSDIPPGENKWSEQTATDSEFLHYTKDQGLDNFHHYYASNTGIPGPFRPRPKRTITPVFEANGIQQLFADTRLIQYSTEDGKSPPIPLSLANEPLIEQYNLAARDVRKENCGCTGELGVLPFL